MNSIISSCVAQSWKRLPGAAVEISAKGSEVWVINAAQNIYRWTGSDWELKRGSAVRAGASPDGWTWVVNSADNIYRWNKNSNKWDQMPGALVQIDAISKDRALGVNRVGNIYLWENNAWKQLPGAATWAGIGNGGERWVVNKAQQIFRWNHSTNVWDRMPGAAVNIDVQNPGRVIVTNANDKIWDLY
ncbi:Tectonin-1, partial [Pseudolycoriella hygida]